MRVGTCIRVGIRLEKAEVGPTSGPTWRLSHLQTSATVTLCRNGEAALLGVDVKVILTPPPYTLYKESLMEYTGWCHSDFNVQG
jgi:hypothetical protein